MRVEVAVYGEVKGGHALRGASGDKQFAANIASKLDLPDTAPPGLPWSPYASGFASGERYVLARTFADLTAPRSGMVLTHALIVPTAELIQFRNLESLFGRLIRAADQAVILEGFDVQDDQGRPTEAADLIGAANALTSQGTGPVVRLGTQGFEALVASLWANLWPEVRVTFSFRLSFGPTDIVEDPSPLIVCTPVALAARWTRYRIVSQAEGQEPASATANVIAGKLDPTPLKAFAREIGAKPRSLADLQLIEQAHFLLSGVGLFDDILAVIRLIERLSPDPSAGIDAKKAIADRLSKSVALATPDQILALRNLILSGFPKVPNLWKAVEFWLASRQYEPADDASLTTMIASAINSATAVESWRAAVHRGIEGAARSDGLALSRAIWRWVAARSDLLSAFFGLLPTDHSVEVRVASVTPAKITPTAADPILKIALARRWFAVHGAVLSASDDPIGAIRRQIEVDHDVADTTGIRLALRAATPTQVLKCAVEHGDVRLVDLAADAVVADPTIFSDALCRELSEQAIWETALRRNGQLWQAPSDPSAARSMVLNGLIDGGRVHMPLVSMLAQTPLADLCDFPRREQVWNDRRDNGAHEYLQATSVGWLTQSATRKVPFQPDAMLKSAILSGAGLDVTLSDLVTEPIAVVRIVEVLDGFTEQRFLVWFKIMLSRVKVLPLGGAEALGRLVLARSWHRVIDTAVGQYRGHRSDLKPLLRVCASMLSIFTQWMLDLSEPTASEKWESFANVAAELYPSGPDHDELWSRAGGKNSDLPKSGSGGSAWRTVIGQMRNGRGPSPMMLLRVMRQDYGSNEQLRYLANDRDISNRR